MNGTGRTIEEITVAGPAEAYSTISGRDTPAIIRGLCPDWPLVRHSGDPAAIERYLLTHYEGAPVTAFIGTPDDRGRLFYTEDLSKLNFEQIRTRLDDVLLKLREAAEQASPPTIYMGSMAMRLCVPGIESANSLPRRDPPASVRIWIGNRSRVAAHFDVLDNIACVCAGRRRFTLFPPEQVENLYIGPIDLTPAGQQISLVDPDDPDFERFPRYRDALEQSQSSVLEPGDAIYIPSMWWHQVSSLSSFNILINHWWRDVPDYMGAPGDVLLHALLNLRDLPDRQRKAWRALFDHYVFDPPADALSHIPTRRRGPLDGLDDDAARRLRALLRNQLNR